MGNIRRLQEGLKSLWTDELYSEQFKESKSVYKHFDHTLKHIRKAAQAIENMTEEADHHGASAFEEAAIKKYVADILISAVRLANVCPIGEFDVEDVTFTRVERKMGVRIPHDSEDK